MSVTMPTSKFDLVKNLPKQSQKLERFTSTDSCMLVIEEYNSTQGEPPSEDNRQQQQLGDDDSKGQIIAESNSSLQDVGPSKLNRSKSVPDKLSQNGIDQTQNVRRKTVILLETDGKGKKNNPETPILHDKG